MINAVFISIFEPDYVLGTIVLFIISFSLWRVLKDRMEPEEGGYVFDHALFFLGLLSAIYLYINMDDVLFQVRRSSFFSGFLIVLIGVPLLIFMGYLSRFLKRLDRYRSLKEFAVHNIIDLIHVLFFMSSSVLIVSAIFSFI